MLVSDVISLAKTGELQQLAAKDEPGTVLGFINLGLIELYKRFPLRTEEMIIPLDENTTIYTMPSDFMYIVGAFDEVPEGLDGISVPIVVNEDSPFSINTVSYNQIQIPLVTGGAYVSVIYAAKPTWVTVDTLDTEIAIPDSLIEALLHYIGYRGHGAIDANLQTETNSHYLRFEASCRKAKELGVVIAPDSLAMPLRLNERGFA